MEHHQTIHAGGDAGIDNNTRSRWIEDDPLTDTAETRKNIQLLARPLGSAIEAWEIDRSSFAGALRRSGLFYREPDSRRLRLRDDRFADALARGIGSQASTVVVPGLLWQLGTTDRTICKSRREVYFLKRFHSEDESVMRTVFDKAPSSAFIVLGGGDTAALPPFLARRAFSLAKVARLGADGVLRLSWRAFGQRRPEAATEMPGPLQKKVRLAAALDRLYRQLVEIARRGDYDALHAAVAGVSYRLVAEESGLPVDTIRNLLHRKDVNGRPLHAALVFEWRRCRDEETILCDADSAKTHTVTKTRRELAAKTAAERNGNSMAALIDEAANSIQDHGDRATALKGRIAGAQSV